jgi:APA family basic amino acid/polyamine antiporter
MMAGLNIHTWYRLLGWLAIGLVVYFLYSRHHSKLNKSKDAPEPVENI